MVLSVLVGVTVLLLGWWLVGLTTGTAIASRSERAPAGYTEPRPPT
jgi:hypothetical protein